MEEDVRGIPFWEDLFAVTGAVPPWGMFKLLAEHPEIITRVPVPLTFLMVPGDKIEARLCTGTDQKLLIRRTSHSDPISFETMAHNLKSCFESRGSDGQPFVCTIYGDDWRPRFVLSEAFNLFILYLRHSCGETLSSSYGPEEQREANALFSPNICMIQAYLPLESQTRYLAVTLRSPVSTLLEVYRAQHLGKGCFTNSKDTLDSIVVQHTHGDNDFYQPLDNRVEPDAQLAVQISASVISNLRKQCNIKIQALVCEFVRDIQGDLYLVAVSRCSKPQASGMSSPLQPFRPPDARLQRILGKQPPTSKSALRRSTITSIASGASRTSLPASPQTKQSPLLEPGKRVPALGLRLNVDEEERKEGLETSKQTAGKSLKRGGFPETLSINVFPEKKEAAAEKVLSMTPEGLDIDDPHPVSKNLEQEPGALKLHGELLSDRHQALIERAQVYHDEGRFEEALRILADAEKAALDAIAQKHPKQAAALRAEPPNALCFRCGDTVSAKLDKSGYSHFEWRSMASSASTRDTLKRMQDKNKLATSRRSRRVESLQKALHKLEHDSYATTPREEYEVDTKKSLQLTMCKQCLEEAGKNPRNAEFVRGIQKFRNELSIPVIAGTTT